MVLIDFDFCRRLRDWRGQAREVKIIIGYMIRDGVEFLYKVLSYEADSSAHPISFLSTEVRFITLCGLIRRE